MRDSQRARGVLLALIGLWASAPRADAASFVERLSPPSLCRGTTTRVTLVGSALGGATGLWTSTPGRAVTAALEAPSRDDQATFEVTVRADAPLGLHGLRLATRDGLSNLKLFLVDDLPAVMEREPVGHAERPQPLNWPVAVVGRAGDAEVDRYVITVQAGQSVTFEVVGNRLGQDFDPVVTIKDARGRLVVERDNDIGLMFDCRFAHTFESTGTYTIEVRDTRFRGSDHTAYVLRVGYFPEGRVAYPSTIRAGESLSLSVPGDARFTQQVTIPPETAPGDYFQELRRPGDQASAWVPVRVAPFANALEREPNDVPAGATLAPIPSVLHGTITTPDDRDAFALNLVAGQRWNAHIECRSLGSPADLDVSLIDPGGKTIKRLDTLPDGEANFEIQAPSNGRYVVLVRSLTGEGGTGYVYRITVAPREPAVQLVSEATSLAVPRGSYQSLPLSLTRTDFAGPVALELRGAPSGMALRSGTIPGGETDVDNAITVADSVPEGIYSVQVVTRWPTAGGERTAIATTLPLVDRLPTGRGPHGEPFELREDQRRLPPTLTDRIAILVTPPSPFTFELPDRSVVLPRYLAASFRLETTRVDGFDAPITFVARGGTLEPLNLQKPRVKAEIPQAARDQAAVVGLLRSGVNTELRTHRITVTAHASRDGRAIDLTRTFELRIQVAYEPSAEPGRLEIRPGESATVAILGNRASPFAGPISVLPSGVAGWELTPVKIAEGTDRGELKIVVPTGTKPGVYRVELAGSARVSKFDEAVKGKPIEVVVAEPKGE